MNFNLKTMKKITLLFLTAIAFMSCAAQNLENLKTALPPNSVAITGVNTVTAISMQALAAQLLPFLNLQSGIQGPAGPQGLQGAKGDKGDIGPPGNNGVDGQTGAQGATGAVGATGAQGNQGLPGKDGILGLPPLCDGCAWVSQNGVIAAVPANFLVTVTQLVNQTASQTLIPVTLVRGGNYEVSAPITINSGTGSVSVKYAYIDAVSGNQQTVTPTGNTLTVINAKPGSVITFTATVAGTVNYSFNPFIYTR